MFLQDFSTHSVVNRFIAGHYFIATVGGIKNGDVSVPFRLNETDIVSMQLQTVNGVQ